jgi:hypothetical protein
LSLPPPPLFPFSESIQLILIEYLSCLPRTLLVTMVVAVVVVVVAVVAVNAVALIAGVDAAAVVADAPVAQAAVAPLLLVALPLVVHLVVVFVAGLQLVARQFQLAHPLSLAPLPPPHMFKPSASNAQGMGLPAGRLRYSPTTSHPSSTRASFIITTVRTSPPYQKDILFNLSSVCSATIVGKNVPFPAARN